MKLIIQIPCFNEEMGLPRILRELPASIPGIAKIEILIIDDGSTDQTVKVARAHGVRHVVSLGKNHGLAKAFSIGVETALALGADIIVNTDADNQYKSEYIPALIEPILNGKADLVVGSRPIEEIDEFSWLKKKLQRFGSWVVRKISGTEVPDVTSGFRAYSRSAALRVFVQSRFTYTLETLIQAGQRGFRVAAVDIEVNPATRESRLFRSSLGYVFRSLVTLLLVSTQFRPLWTFCSLGILSIFLGLIPSVRFLFLFLARNQSGHVQSLVMAAILILFGATSCLIGLLAEQVASNRRILEETLAKSRDLTLGVGHVTECTPLRIGASDGKA